MSKVESLNLQKETPEGEMFIQDFLKQVGIKFEFQKKIEGLKNDVKSYRVADFYLPEYDVYIELLGLWGKGTPENNEDYIKKKIAYKKNNIACIYLYYENLGYLYHALDQRMILTLKKHNKLKELQKYRIYKFKKTVTPNIIVFLLALGLLPVIILGEEKIDTSALILVTCIFLFQTYRIYHYYNLIFIRDRFSLFNQFIDK